MLPQPQAYCYDNPAKNQQSREMKAFYRAAAQQLPAFTFKTHFNSGGIAVWGETYAKIYLRHDIPGAAERHPVVEAYDTSMGLLVRQWDGRNSGRNHYVST